MEYTCPHCQSKRIVSRNHGRKTCGALGTLAGAHLAVRSIHMGTMIGRFFGPPGLLLGGTAGLVIAGISGAMLGGSTGARLGTMLDNNVLNNYHCLSCKTSFSEPGTTVEGEYLRFDSDDEDMDEDEPSYPAIR